MITYTDDGVPILTFRLDKNLTRKKIEAFFGEVFYRHGYTSCKQSDGSYRVPITNGDDPLKEILEQVEQLSKTEPNGEWAIALEVGSFEPEGIK
tara:strand:- start:1181 stop:1462 length:282 start_codon:yes stop_codon:yes gene_type:complete